ncbi:MAG TPA: FHA domain-containing protein [Polyangiaceae bacterium LLY-WYZ-15_(1-7)]|nr:FHA domain-containing protein [Polyangiaceae bacterium LLY-WYZ-15_(1-7)]HJL06092.1 FHA domain-containing protein [Polyangiaceae bacterium LLY-WYZ-15_(1-7)]HJL06982.1 FHA domain-containing protein [Polyangiaceae bacterium LLY-WYZ-15_(1-7)]HJL39152.1 FHA domain-containing protein [Polyangiaceae bacterium LLY-WYZ-15_(1-7)]
MFKLVISDDEGKTTVVPLVRDEITIGRKEGNTIRLTERNVSRRHARLEKAGGAYQIVDLNSYNGVKINGRRIEAETQTRLQPGDQVTIGDYVLALQAEGATEEMPAPPVSSEPVPPPRLVMLTPPAPGAEFALTRDGMRIGRAEDLDIWINHRSISREHAVVRVEGDQIRVQDLESANGVRLNGKDVTDAPLSSGDVLELGQVRFRFVAAGEKYVFEAGQTVQMDAVSFDDVGSGGGGSRAPLVAAVVIVLIAVAVGAAIAFTSDGEEQGQGVVTVDDPGESGTPDEPPPDTEMGGPTPAEAAQTATRQCETALESEEWGDALAAADRALELDPASADARSCRDRAREAQRAAETFARGVEALDEGDAEGAYFAFEELPEDSAFRQRPEVARARQAFVDENLQAARENVTTDPSAAIRHANAVLTTPELSLADQRAAQSILRQAQRRGGRPTMDRTMRATMRSTMDTQTADTSTMDSTMESSGGPVDPAQVMRDCSLNQRCIAQRLRGNANTPRAMGILIEAYKAIGDSASAQRTMRQLISRFPSSRQASQYRRQLNE